MGGGSGSGLRAGLHPAAEAPTSSLSTCKGGVELTSGPKLQPKDPGGFQNQTLPPVPAHSGKRDLFYLEPGNRRPLCRFHPFHSPALRAHGHALPPSGVRKHLSRTQPPSPLGKANPRPRPDLGSFSNSSLKLTVLCQAPPIPGHSHVASPNPESVPITSGY